MCFLVLLLKESPCSIQNGWRGTKRYSFFFPRSEKTSDVRTNIWLFKGGSKPYVSTVTCQMLTECYWEVRSIIRVPVAVYHHTELTVPFLFFSCWGTRLDLVIFQIALIMSGVITCQRLAVCVIAAKAVLCNRAGTTGTAHLRPNLFINTCS